MSRFPIRIQLFLLAAAFIVALMTVSGVSWAVKMRLQSDLDQDHALFVQEAALSEILIQFDESEIYMLGYALGDAAQWKKFSQHWQEGHAALAHAVELLNGEAGPTAEDLATIDQLHSIAADLRALEPHFATARTEAQQGQSESVRNVLQPGIEDAKHRLTGLIAIAHEAWVASSQRAQEDIANSTIILLIVSVSAIVFSLCVTFFFGRALAVPIRSAAKTVTSLANKNYDSEIFGTKRQDELGQILKNLACLRDELRSSDEQQAKAQKENDLRVDLFEALSTSLGALRAGDLSHRMTVGNWEELGGEYVTLCHDYNNLCVALDDMVSELRNSARTVESSANGLAEMSSDMSHRAETQAATLEESAASLEDLSERVKQSANRAQEAKDLVVEGRRRAEEGGGVMQDALQAMSSIAKSSDQITQIIDVIDDIAFQTNLLSLNAGVEAARAGESGRGFAVVASEVRSLAQRAAESANEIKSLVLNSTQQVQEGQELVTATSETLGHIVESVNVVSEAVSAIAENAVEQANSVQEVNVGVGELEKVTHENTLGVRQTKVSSEGLSSEAMRLTHLLAKFRGFSGEAGGDPSKVDQTVETPPEYGEIVIFSDLADVAPKTGHADGEEEVQHGTPMTSGQGAIGGADDFADAEGVEGARSPVEHKVSDQVEDASISPPASDEAALNTHDSAATHSEDGDGSWKTEVQRFEASEAYQAKEAKTANQWEDF